MDRKTRPLLSLRGRRENARMRASIRHLWFDIFRSIALCWCHDGKVAYPENFVLAHRRAISLCD
jgi:hypothetical protein